MSDLERRLGDALTEGAQEAPSAIGLAAAARTRARERRRARVAAGAAGAVLAVAVPAAGGGLGGGDGGSARVGAPVGVTGRGSTAVDPNQSPSAPTDTATDWPDGGGYRW